MSNPPRTATTFSPPVMEARRWLEGVEFHATRPLINVSQAAPVDPPHPEMRAAMAQALNDDSTHLYGPVLGHPGLRDALARRTSEIYGGSVSAAQTAITSGCNQAFAAAIAALCAEGDEVMLPVPWYFNHKMWLDMSGVAAVPLPCDDGMLPLIDAARDSLTDRTRAIALVTPNNPTGREYPAALMDAFFDLCAEKGIALIVDETYRDFHADTGAPHDLFRKPGWDETLIQLYSFSKAYRLTGHRVGAIVTSPDRLAEAEKFLDTVAICPPQLGQIAALWGMENLDQWLAGERAEILARRAAISAHFPPFAADGWALMGLGGYFAYMRHPFDMSSDELAPLLVRDAGILCLPGTMFHPVGGGADELRIAFANLDADGIGTLFERLAELDLPRRAG